MVMPIHLLTGRIVMVDKKGKIVSVLDKNGMPDDSTWSRAEVRDFKREIDVLASESDHFAAMDYQQHERFKEARDAILDKYSEEQIRAIDSSPYYFNKAMEEALEDLPLTDEQGAQKEQDAADRKQLRKQLKDGKVHTVQQIADVLHSEMKRKGLTGLEGHPADQDTENDTWASDDDGDDDD